jgi:hypothetical protein
MTLHEFLKVCGKNDYVGIYNMDTPYDKKYKSRERFEVHPMQQSYCKVNNIPYGRIRYFLEYEIVAINHTAKGYYVRIHSPQHREEMDRWLLAREIAKEMGVK